MERQHLGSRRWLLFLVGARSSPSLTISQVSHLLRKYCMSKASESRELDCFIIQLVFRFNKLDVNKAESAGRLPHLRESQRCVILAKTSLKSFAFLSIRIAFASKKRPSRVQETVAELKAIYRMEASVLDDSASRIPEWYRRSDMDDASLVRDERCTRRGLRCRRHA